MVKSDREVGSLLILAYFHLQTVTGGFSSIVNADIDSVLWCVCFLFCRRLNAIETERQIERKGEIYRVCEGRLVKKKFVLNVANSN